MAEPEAVCLRCEKGLVWRKAPFSNQAGWALAERELPRALGFTCQTNDDGTKLRHVVDVPFPSDLAAVEAWLEA